MGGLDFAPQDYPLVSSLARSLARWQDTVLQHRTFGRIADRVAGSRVTYGGADVAPWFIREAYDHVTRSRDTALLRDLYPVIRRSIEGARRFHVDTYNLMTHEDGETWMNSRSTDGEPLAPRGNRAAEMQLLWYFQQLIGSYAATFLGDGRVAEVWGANADSTGSSFNLLFLDTVANRVYDHISADGTPSGELRPNTMLCLELIGSELVQQSMLKRIIGQMVYAHGVGSLDPADPRFRGSGGGIHNGPVWSWLAGPVAYALTRYDRQDVAYSITSSMVRQALDRDLAGTIPEAFDASLAGGAPVPAAGARRASLHGMSEVFRSLYQDFFGVRIDVPSNVISIQPRLPHHLTQVDMSIQFGTEPVWLLYRTEAEKSELIVKREGGEREIVLNLLWMMPNGNAWRGSMRVPPREITSVTFTSDDMSVRKGDESADVTGKWYIKAFSRANEFGDVKLAEPPAR
jgi:glycogen debranching enzyme